MSASALSAESQNVALTVSDLQRSVKFYTTGLGFEIIHKYEVEGRLQYAAMQGGGARIGVGQDDFKKGRDRSKGIGMRIWITTTQDLQSIADRVKAAGFAVDDGPMATPWGTMVINLTDPDGFKVSIDNPAPPPA